MTDLKALVFDVFGTVVDWRSAVIREGEALGRKRGIERDWAAFADAWRGRYVPSMQRVRHAELPWTKLDDLHRASLEELLDEFGVEGLSEEDKDHFNLVWHRPEPWPDAVEGLSRLKRRYVISPLSNGNVALLTNMSKKAGLPWDLILSAELVCHYKPDPETYLMAPALLDLDPEEVMMVAAHVDDLRAAREHGLRTAHVPRPLEFGPGGGADPPDHSFDVVAENFVDLERVLADWISSQGAGELIG
jgi:2-haloacid dehalogenase